jgi:hypothetical protein
MDVKEIQGSKWLIDPIHACVYELGFIDTTKLLHDDINVYKTDLLNGLKYGTSITFDTYAKCHEINHDVYMDLVKIAERVKFLDDAIGETKLQEEGTKHDDLNFELPESKPNQFFY